MSIRHHFFKSAADFPLLILMAAKLVLVDK